MKNQQILLIMVFGLIATVFGIYLLYTTIHHKAEARKETIVPDSSISQPHESIAYSDEMWGDIRIKPNFNPEDLDKIYITNELPDSWDGNVKDFNFHMHVVRNRIQRIDTIYPDFTLTKRGKEYLIIWEPEYDVAIKSIDLHFKVSRQ